MEGVREKLYSSYDYQVKSVKKDGLQRKSKKELQAGGVNGEGNTDQVSEIADRVDLSEDEWTVSESALLDELKKMSEDYPDVTILFQKEGEDLDLAETAKKLGEGRYIIISHEFLKRMGLSREEYERCKTVFEDAVKCLAEVGSGKVSAGIYLKANRKECWSVSKKVNEIDGMLHKGSEISSIFGEKKEQENKVKTSSVVSYDTRKHYAGLARAGSKGEVQMVMGQVHRSIVNLRLAACFGEKKEQIKAGRAIRSLQKLLARGNRKIKMLNHEDILKAREKHAEKERNEKKVLKIKIERKRRRIARSSSDSNLARGGVSNLYVISGEKRVRRYGEYEKDQVILQPVDLSGSMSTAGAGGDVSFGTSDVVISDGGSF